MKRFTFVLILLILLAACNGAPEQPAATGVASPLPPAPTAAEATQAVLPTADLGEATATEPALATVETPATAEPPTGAPTITPLPTETLPTAAPTAESAAPTATNAATDAPTAAPPVELFAPGQQDGASLAEGGTAAYLVQGRRFEPIILFVEPTNELNVALAAYVGDQTGQTTPEGVTPPAAADNALGGRPEILVLSPEADGLYTLVVRAVGGEGSFAAHLFDLTTPAPGVVVQQPDALSAGAEIVYSVTSNGARPVIAVADPTDQSDIALDVLAGDGTLLTTANYGGAGGVETAYVLPLGTTPYSVKIREANGGPAAFQILVITLE